MRSLPFIILFFSLNTYAIQTSNSINLLIAQFDCLEQDFNLLSLSETKIDQTIEKCRKWSQIFDYDEKEVLKILKTKIEAKIEYHRKKLGNKRDENHIKRGLTLSAATIGFALATYLLHTKYNEYMEDDMSLEIYGLIGTFVFGFDAILSCIDGFNPRHQERYEKYCLINSKIDTALNNDLLY